MQYVNSSWPDVERDHAAVITYLDNLVGNLTSRLKKLHVDDNTLVIFASDNGAHLEGGHKKEFFDSTGGLQGNKRSLYEGGYRSPTMMRWPLKVAAGRVSSFPWAFWDVIPTLAELAGVSPPEGDGISIVPELTQTGTQDPHEYLFWTWGATAATSGYSVRIGDWKGIVESCTEGRPGDADGMLLFDVVHDAYETQDRSADHMDKVETLKKMVQSKNLTCQCYQCR